MMVYLLFTGAQYKFRIGVTYANDNTDVSMNSGKVIMPAESSDGGVRPQSRPPASIPVLASARQIGRGVVQLQWIYNGPEDVQQFIKQVCTVHRVYIYYLTYTLPNICEKAGK